MKYLRSLLLALCALPALGQNQLGFVLSEGEHRAQFPIEIVNNLVIVPLVLNGQIPLKFILDTGVRTTILTEKAFSDILHLTYTRRYTVAGPGGEKLVEAYVTNNVTLDLPGVHGEGHAMLVLEKDYLELRNYLGSDVHVVLGYEIFSRFIVEINYHEKKLTVTDPEFFKPKKSFEVIPITVEDTKPYIRVPVEMKPGLILNCKLLVDSGASHGLILEPVSDKRIQIPEKHVSSQIGRGLGGIITGQIARVKALDIGKYKIENIIANFPDINSYTDTLKSTDVFRNGSIGGEVLSRFTTIYDFSNEKMYIKKNRSFRDKFNFNMSGLTMKAKGAFLRKYEVTDIRKDSPGEKSGMKIGDELLMINGIPVGDLDLDVLNGYFNSKPGKKIKIEYLRGSTKMNTALILESPI